MGLLITVLIVALIAVRGGGALISDLLVFAQVVIVLGVVVLFVSVLNPGKRRWRR